MGYVDAAIWDTRYITDYIVVTANDKSSLGQKVQNNTDNEGWQPHGSVEVTITWYGGYSREYCQAMVKYREQFIAPNVVGFPVALAVSTIPSYIIGNVTYANSVSVPIGYVISQNPVGGTVIVLPDTVDIVVSLGPPPPP